MNSASRMPIAGGKYRQRLPVEAAQILIEEGTTCSPPETANAPPGRKSFCTSATINASSGAKEKKLIM
jgi:hypothetical protein